MVGFGIGRSIGALISTFIYARLGFPAVTMAAAAFNVLAMLALAEMQGKIRIVPRVLSWLHLYSGRGTGKS
jgi:predicted MFS family arabinose efflux permease